MAVKKGQRRKESKTVVEQIEEQPPVESRFVLLVALATLLLVVYYDYLVARPTGDTYMMLAGGRDVYEGKLAQPDEWAFTTKDRVWINQNWGTSVLFYTAWKMMGYNGIVVIKAVAIALMGLFLVLAARQMKATTTVAMLVSSFALLTAVNYIDMRANTIGLTFLSVLIWLLYWSHERPHRIWVVLALIFLWTHMHGSFIFGIAVLGLWTVVVYGMELLQGNGIDGLKRLWPLPTATGLVILLSVVTSPFGLTNLQLPFSYIGLFQKEVWPMPAAEMNPLFHPNEVGFGLPGSLWYLFTLGWLLAPLTFRLMEITAGKPKRGEFVDTAFRTKWLFTLILTVITIVMAFRSRRFVPLSLIAFAPLMAYETQRLLYRRGLAWLCGPVILLAGLFGFYLAPTILGWFQSGDVTNGPVDPRRVWSAAGLVLALSPLLGMLIYALGRRVARRLFAGSLPNKLSWLNDRERLKWAPLLIAAGLIGLVAWLMPAQLYYHSENFPGSPRYDTFGRMIFLNNFPGDALKFMVDNDITGNVMNEWRWESFLHWHHPEAKAMFGGRSRTAYSPNAARVYQVARNVKNYSLHEKLGIDLLLEVGGLGQKNRIAAEVFTDPKTPWIILFYDGGNILAANERLPKSEQYIADARAGRLEYPTVHSEKCTLAARRLALSSFAKPAEIFEACREANAEFPVVALYHILVVRAQNGLIDPKQTYAYLLSEAVRLANVDYHRPQGLSYLACRQYLAQALANVYSRNKPPHPERAEFWKNNARQLAEAIQIIKRRDSEPTIDPIPEEFKKLR